MLNYTVANISHLKATNVKNMLEEFVKHSVSLNDVYSAAKKLTAQIKPAKAQIKAQAKIEKSAMLEKLIDARKHERKTHFSLVKAKSDMSKYVRPATYVRKLSSSNCH